MRSLIVSIHDVTPAHARAIQRLYDLLEAFGVSSYALFVVPNWHGDWPLSRYPDFVAQLGQRADRGCEILLHGLRHDEVGSRRSLAEGTRAFGRTAREAEFLTLTDDAAGTRVRQGREALRAVGLETVGFVPPAWLYRASLRQVLREQGFRFLEDAWWIYDLEFGVRLRAPAVQWSTRKAYRAAAGVAINAVRVPVERGRRLVRLAIHPPDVEHPWVGGSLRRTLERLVAQRTVVTYRQALGSARPSAGAQGPT